MNQIPPEMQQLYREAKELIESTEDIKVYSHIDCDGMCAGAILSTILDRNNKKHEINFVNLDELNDLEITNELTIFSDLGSSQEVYKNAKKGHKIIILDHHPPLKNRDINPEIKFIEINPNNYERDSGSNDICGGGLCYLLAKEFGYQDLSWIGVLSAVGDMQNSEKGKLTGLNDLILQDAVNGGYVQLNKSELNIYGRNSRPLHVALSYFSDVQLPITNNSNETLALLSEIGIPRNIYQIEDLLTRLNIPYQPRISFLNEEDQKKVYNRLVEEYQEKFNVLDLGYESILKLLIQLKINTPDKLQNLLLDCEIYKDDLEITEYNIDKVLESLNSGEKKRLLRRLLEMQKQKLEGDYLRNNKETTIFLLNVSNYRRTPTRLNDLTFKEKSELFGKIHSMLSTALPAKYQQHISKLLIQDTYDFLMEDEDTPLRDAAEFSTAMNACGRNKEYQIALEILKGDRQEALKDLEKVSRKHRYNLATSIGKVTNNPDKIKELNNLQYFQADDIKPEIVGTVTGMILGYCNWRKPVLGLSNNKDTGFKVSLRCSRLLAYSGIHFGEIIRKISQEIGGNGGGHSVACGAYIPEDKKDEFIEKFDARLNGLIDK